ncbi:pali-domain-containing protein [Hypoxylon crocopeplum]|nr:pali-domain-containing protein [Hypoxylon crocopeplum]
MLRPATPLAVLLFAAFAMLLLAVLSTPIIKAIPLGTYKGVSFGVFGTCGPDKCSQIEIGYDTSRLFTPTDSATFDLPVGTRTTLSAILVVHPVACFLTLVMLILAIVAHLHSPSHSSRYLLLLFIFGIITFLVCLLAFLIDVLLFVPHMAWGSYIVLAATILVFLSFIVSCAMRRTLVSRKARKRRIAENAEMSGENYYNRQAQQEAESVTTAPREPTVPVVSGANGPSDKLPAFASFENKDDRSSDERIPLTARTPSDRSPNHVPADTSLSGSTYNVPQRSDSNISVARDQYGNPIDPSQENYKVRRGPSFERMNARGRGGPPAGYRGRGGYGRGGYGAPYGPPPGGRGGYGPPPNGRGGYGPPGRGGYGPPPNGRGGYGPGPRGGYGPGGMMRGGRTPPPTYPGGGPYDRRPSPAAAYGDYGPGRQVSPTPPGGSYGMEPPMPNISTGTTEAGSFQAYNPDRASDLPRAESPPPLPGVDDAHRAPVGQAVEMDASTGSPAHPPRGFGQFNNQLRDSDADVAGMLALQQARTSTQRHDTYMSEGSRYSQEDQYVPPRQVWNQGPGRSSPGVPSPLHIPSRPQELSNGTPPPPPPPQQSTTTVNTGNYYEDVDPRFTEPASRPQQSAQELSTGYDDVPPQPRSPAISEQSGFTSVSQRGINPRWNPPPNQGYNPQMPPRKPVGRNEVNVLNSNPDFQLPSTRGGPGAGRGGGLIPGSSYPGI